MYGLFRTLRNLKAKDLTKKLADATDLIQDPETKKKVVAGLVVGGAAVSALWALKSYQQWKQRHEELGFVDWMMSEPEE